MEALASVESRHVVAIHPRLELYGTFLSPNRSHELGQMSDFRPLLHPGVSRGLGEVKG